MGKKTMMNLDQLGQHIHSEVKKKFRNRSMPTEKVSENFMYQTVRAIMKNLQKQGEIPFIPEFQILNKTSMEDRFNENIPDFSRHINLIGLGKDTEYDEYGVMNIAINGEDAQTFEDQVQGDQPKQTDQSDEEAVSEKDVDKQEKDDTKSEEVPKKKKEIPDYLTVIEGGKSS